MADIAIVQQQLSKLYKSDARTKVVITLEGPAGIGKSAIVKGVAMALGIEMVDLRLAQMADASDIVGLPRTNPETMETVYCKPDYWPKPDTKGILFLDEPNRGAPDVKQGVFQLMTDRRIHTNVLPDGWMVVMAQNPSNDASGISYDVQGGDAAWNSRSLCLQVSVTPEGFLTWARENGVNDLIIRFLSLHTELVYSVKDDGAFPCPRTWEMLSNLMNADAIIKDIEADMIRGLIGVEAATNFIKFMDKAYNKPVSGKQVLEEFISGKVDRTDDNGVTKQMPIKDAVKKQQTDENTATVRDLMTYIGKKDSLTDTELKNLGGFVQAIPKEIAMSAFKKLNRKILMELGKSNKDVMELVKSIMKEMQAGR